MTAGSKTVVLDQAYAAAAPGDTKPGQSNAADVSKNFADVLAAILRVHCQRRYVRFLTN